jgi:hypothetical protein
MSFERELIKAAEAEGLTYAGTEHHRKHTWLFFDNEQGMRMRCTVPHGSVKNNYRYQLNCIAHFKRFARGQTHGLILVAKEMA